MTPMQLIKTGLLERDLQKIADGYAAISGEMVPVPQGNCPAGVQALEALRWYADEANYDATGLVRGRPIAVMVDGGRTAREALGAGSPVGQAPAGEVAAKAETPKSKPAKKPPAKARKGRTAQPVANTPKVSEQVSLVKPRAKRAMNWEPPDTNQWRDDLTIAEKDRKSTRWINENITPTQKRPPVNDPEVEVKCDWCGGGFVCRRSEVRTKKPEGGENDIGTENVCQKCIKRGHPGE